MQAPSGGHIPAPEVPDFYLLFAEPMVCDAFYEIRASLETLAVRILFWVVCRQEVLL